MRWNRERELRISRYTHGLLGVLLVMGLVVFVREFPAIRRYLRMERM
jgi:hypothetical protein